MFWKRKAGKKVVGVAVGAFAILFLFPFVYIWFTAPADPKYNGKRLSNLLYEAYGGTLTKTGILFQPKEVEECNSALKALGPKAAPLLTAWIENRPSVLRDRIREFLLKQKLNWPYFTADHQDIVERLLFRVPEAAVPVAEAFQYQIMHGEPRDAMRAASLFAYVLNSADEPSRAFIASRSEALVDAILDEYERDSEDSYPLSLVGLIIKNHPASLTPERRGRIIKLGRNSRYLGTAVDTVNSSAQTTN